MGGEEVLPISHRTSSPQAQIVPSGHNEDNPLPCHLSSSRGRILNGFPEVGIFCIKHPHLGLPFEHSSLWFTLWPVPMEK